MDSFDDPLFLRSGSRGERGFEDGLLVCCFVSQNENKNETWVRD